MGYLKEFQTQITNRDFAKFLRLWEEYCTCDEADIEEIRELLTSIKTSEFAKPFGPYVEMLLPLWETIPEQKAYSILSLIIDLQTTNSQNLANLALVALTKRYAKELSTQDRNIQEQLRLVGLRTKENFQSALSNFDLLMHFKKGNFVFHGSGFGVGEIMDYSPLRELVTLEFENVSGLKQITFSNAFKSLSPIPSDHFLARRFSDPDTFEKEAKEDALSTIKLLLKDLGPKTASEIKDELAELVIPEKDWQKWWQNARAKLKKDTEIESPASPKEPFVLRKESVSHEDQFLDSLKKKKSFSDLLTACYNFSRDHAPKLKVDSVKNEIVTRIESFLKSGELKPAEILQAYFFLDTIHGGKYEAEIAKIIRQHDALDSLIEQIDIIVYKKMALAAIKTNVENWPTTFLKLLNTCSQGLLRDYIIKELVQNNLKGTLEQGLKNLLENPWENPDLFVWYYLKIMHEQEDKLPYHNQEGKMSFSEALLVLLNRIENDSGYKELVKKIALLLSSKRYALVRQIFEESSLEFAKEFLLLATKCHTITDHDLKIWRSLAEVVHPSLAKKKEVGFDNTFWTTDESLRTQQERLKRIATTDVVENAREIEAARALGDLRENSEYKSALEKRSHLQREIKKLSHEVSQSRILTPADISKEVVGIGSVIHTVDDEEKPLVFTIMGPWEANPANHILSFHSKVAQGMLGLRIGDQFKFKDHDYTITKLGSIFGDN